MCESQRGTQRERESLTGVHDLDLRGGILVLSRRHGEDGSHVRRRYLFGGIHSQCMCRHRLGIVHLPRLQVGQNGVGNILVVWGNDLRAIAPVDFEPVVCLRVVAGSHHDTGSSLEVVDTKGNKGCGHEVLQVINFETTSKEYGSRDACEALGT
jgi:hypothetical protein